MKLSLVTSAKYSTQVIFTFQSSQHTITDFTAKKGEIAVRYENNTTYLYCGLGSESAFTPDILRSMSGSAVKKATDLKRESVSFCVPPHIQNTADELVHTALIEGIVLGNYFFTKYRSEPPIPPKNIEIVGSTITSKRLREILSVCHAVHLTRDLVNSNADDIYPETLAEVCKDLAKQHSALTCTVLAEKQLKELKMGLIEAVGKGSSQSPRLIILHYRGTGTGKKSASTKSKTGKRIALIGKGVTFDSGGYNLKPTGSLETMKTDMAGAATVIGVMKALCELNLKVDVVGILPAAHNAISGTAYFPGDSYKSYSGKTVEIINTDAEGRLILADALSYCQKMYSPNEIIDLATLTGSIIYSFGDFYAGLFSNNDDLAQRILTSGDRTNERMWRMPMVESIQESLKSDLADLRNTSKLPRGHAGAICGAAFIQAFVENNTPWAHLDIAGVAYNEREDRGDVPKYATGYGVRMLIDFLSHL